MRKIVVRSDPNVIVLESCAKTIVKIALFHTAIYAVAYGLGRAFESACQPKEKD